MKDLDRSEMILFLLLHFPSASLQFSHTCFRQLSPTFIAEAKATTLYPKLRRRTGLIYWRIVSNGNLTYLFPLATLYIWLCTICSCRVYLKPNISGYYMSLQTFDSMLGIYRLSGCVDHSL
jgi:hypothetical protein